MGIKRLTIKGFKSIRECKLELRPLNILIGANGSGKSNLISVFALLKAVVDERLQPFSAEVGANATLHFGSKTTPQMEIRLAFGDNGPFENGYAVALAPDFLDDLYFSGEQYWFHDTARYSQPFQTSLGAGHRETKLFEESAQSRSMTIADHVIDHLKRARVYHFHDTSKTATIKQFQAIDDNEDLRDDASNLAAFLLQMQESSPKDYRRIVAAIRNVAPFFEDFQLRPSPRNPDNIRLEWREVGSDAYFNAHSLSDGTLRFMCLATLLLQPELPAVIVIDEPELGLHPYALTVLAGLLRTAAERSQVIVSTQSVPLINQFKPEDIIVVDRFDGQSTFKRLDGAAVGMWLDEYSMGDLWEKNLLGGRPQAANAREGS